MSTTLTRSATKTPVGNSLTAGQLPAWMPWVLLAGALALSAAVFAILHGGRPIADFNIAGTVFVGIILFSVVLVVLSSVVETRRRAADRLATVLVSTAFTIALLPLISLLFTVIVNGVSRFDGEFFSFSMRNIVGEGGGAIHAVWGTLIVTAWAALISVPIGLLTSIYLVEYGRGRLAKAITFFVDVMTGIPSIVAGLFIVAVCALLFGPGLNTGFMGSLALSVLMIPVVVRSSEEMLRLVPNELREASYALGVPKWLTIVKVVLPTSIAGITTGIMLSISRVIGETAPLLLTAGFTQSLNVDAFDGPMMTLPVFVYDQFQNPGTNIAAALERAWAGALTLIIIVMALNLVARFVAKKFAPKFGR
ncbi:phosphate ABC transporter permease PstA [Microbacterium sp. EYE_5]|uniref:phosphate ABC transporter permease PstA n=1 Tax=unclassified Microbacterium TaxID=2609290 RepID=UPI002004A17A|nr:MULTISPECIES: phosphate ABC transporter permease PstA [unclassified Microbacterium]MCK6081783.1 phosphate ABC transporter permease PstA [Microbacterium sp. EYE_382]MCK6087053.1 phosphate ABC transporter permease PstA [Microbacterium sp. EYE_384]MCK6124969.1 phosphate ABC transporter permease PstA [Microbacterium sp. EYE_80]MCK6127816.1 phosphate ABC transporter permease PstA [Microbacterium sp. EYE_79]MCK6142737.1 phosphate ABC transporter permease PstA [Microbacterium sp. EYE_39]